MTEEAHPAGCLYCGNLNTRCASENIASHCAIKMGQDNPQNIPKKEQVNHPQHYGGDTVYETIKVLKAWLTPEQYEGALIFNAVKYLSRYRQKGGKEDVKKAQWYINEFLKEDKS